LRNEAKNLDVLRWIGRSISMPKKFVEEVAKRAGIEPDRQAAQLTDDEVGRVYATVKNLVNDVSTGRNYDPVIIMQSGKPMEALPIVTGEATKLEVKKAASYMDAVDEVLSSEILDISRSSKTIELDRQIAVLEHDLEEQNKAKKAVMQKSAAIRKLAGELMALSSQNPDDDGKLHDVLAANSASIVKEKGVKYVEVLGLVSQ
jgi:predicted ribosome quality control (RQC) complex YloA/Tae2 family protein